MIELLSQTGLGSCLVIVLGLVAIIPAAAKHYRENNNE